MAKKSEPQEQPDVSKTLLKSLVKSHEDSVLNSLEARRIKVSSGSLKLDTVASFATGIHRFVGYTGAGKTSEGLLLIKNYLEVAPRSKGLYVKAEGRLSQNMQERSGIKFVFKAEEWDYGTVFVLETNTFETMVDVIEQLIRSSIESGDLYAIMVDSMDGLVLKGDMLKSIEEGVKVAGPQLLTKIFLKKMSPLINKLGHFCILTSQVSAAIKLDPYSKEAPRIAGGAGGNALAHYPDYILEFENKFNSDYILQNPKEKADSQKNPILGHWVSIIIRKSDQETDGTKIKYPVRRGRTGGNSIWVEYEIVDMLLMFDLIKKGGAWFTVDESLINELKENKLEIPEQFQGQAAIFEFLEQNQDVTKFLFKKFKEAVAK